MKPQNLPETLVWYYILGTYGIYYLGAQYVFAPLLGWFLTYYLLIQWWNQTEKTTPEKKITISPAVWVWIISILIIEIALIIGHLDFNLGTLQIAKSSFNWWLRTWTLLALFPLVGNLNIRPELIYRAACVLCLQSLILAGIGGLAISILNLDELSYISPLEALGGGSEYYYKVNIFGSVSDYENNTRLQLFAPWPPALGLVGNMYFLLVNQEPEKKWRLIGMIGSIVMIVSSLSRLSILSLPLSLGLVWFLTNFLNPWIQFTSGLVSFIGGIFAPNLLNLIETFKENFYKFRSGSSKVRAALARMAIERWWKEAPIWGHGLNDPRGPASLGYMPIGTHHTWFGLLFTHGLVGCMALAIAMSWSFIDLLIKAQTNQIAKVGLSIFLVIFFFSFAENIDSLAYILWPGLVILGIAYKENLGVCKYAESFSDHSCL
ncbi:O-antigen ligase domain-containing protein [Pleurocapsales cyanobacterium LEGE 06147]|nr:O-antigen ligase domain-containing protein [Pleurocapsales cyanobacterium LEGE 06147]